MRDDLMEINGYKLKEYADFLEAHCQQIKILCEAMETDLAIASAAMDTITGKVVVARMQRNIANIKKNMPIYTDLYDRLVLVRKKIQDAINIVVNGGGAGGNFQS